MEKRKTVLFRIFLCTTVYAVVSLTVLEISDCVLAVLEITAPLLSQILSQLCTGAILIFFLKKFSLLTEKRADVRKKREHIQWIRWVLICVCASVALNELLALPFMQQLLPGGQAVEQLYEGSFLFVFVNAVISSPIAEEIFYRGVLHRGIRCLTGPWPAAAVSAALFGLFHMNVVQGIFAGLMGLLFSAVLEQTGRLAVSVLAHISVNLTGVIVTQAGWAKGYGSEPAAAAVAMICAAVCLILLAEQKIRRNPGYTIE